VTEIQGLTDCFAGPPARAKPPVSTPFSSTPPTVPAQPVPVSQAQRRGDRYGGKLLNRARFIYETYEAVRGAVGSDFPVLIKINCEDLSPAAWSWDDSVRRPAPWPKWVGWGGSQRRSFWFRQAVTRPHAHQRPGRRSLFPGTGQTTSSGRARSRLLVGGLRSPETIGQVLERGEGRFCVHVPPPHPRTPLIKLGPEGDTRPAACISCGACFAAACPGPGLYCVQNEKRNREKE
jgi:hypothetical protein